MSEFFKSTPKIDALVNAATNFESIRESMKAELETTGVISRERTDLYGANLLRQPELDAPAAVHAGVEDRGNPTHLRVIYPHLDDRFEITGYDEADLDRKEAAIRQALGQR